MGRTGQGARLGPMVLTAALLAVARADAAGTAYGVDTAEVSEAGNCKVESWLSWASNQDFLAFANPSCGGVPPGAPRGGGGRAGGVWCVWCGGVRADQPPVLSSLPPPLPGGPPGGPGWGFPTQ